MATRRQIEYLRGLGVDPHVRFANLSKEEASDWIQALKGYHDAAGPPPDQPVRKSDLARVAARDGAFGLPPPRSVGSGPVVPGTVTGDWLVSEPASGVVIRDNRSGPAAPADEAWRRLGVSQTFQPESGDGSSVTVAGTEHYRQAPDPAAGEILAERVR